MLLGLIGLFGLRVSGFESVQLRSSLWQPKRRILESMLEAIPLVKCRGRRRVV